MLENSVITIQEAIAERRRSLIAKLRQLVKLEIQHSVFVGFRGLYPTYKIGDRTFRSVGDAKLVL